MKAGKANFGEKYLKRWQAKEAVGQNMGLSESSPSPCSPPSTLRSIATEDGLGEGE
jgi:hypothetical protein